MFALDDRSRQYFLGHLHEIGDGLTRGIAWVTLWDDMLEGHTGPARLLDVALRALPEERDELNVERMLASTNDAFWRYLNDAERAAIAPRLEQTLAGRHPEGANDIAEVGVLLCVPPDGDHAMPALRFLERVWRQQEPIAGLTFAENDFIDMAQELALRHVTATDAILAAQHARIVNPDRKARFAFVMPALSPDAPTRDAFFAALARVENREHERWVSDGLRFLNHPLRRRHAERYIRPSLELLSEIQRTGDIFFPLDWTGAVLAGHNSPAAAETVTAFLGAQKDYPPRLRQVIEQNADQLVRAATLLNK